MNIPEAFRERMKEMLKDESDSFFACYDRPHRRGLRVNPLKLKAEEFEQIAPFPLKRIPWIENGFYYPEGARPAQHPFYKAGLYYLQEPSAMTPADRLRIDPGDRVLDLCAAPGGKATQLAGKVSGGSGKGLLVANEISNSRAKALLRNLELAGAPGCFVTNEHAGNLAAAFPDFFDKILVDAPCSGEGMFRRQEEVAAKWSPERVLEFAALQRNILEEAVKMLRPGGLLMYSTCTFSIDENEGTIAHFLGQHPEMELTEIRPYEGFAPGRPGVLTPEQTQMCVRIWPHRMDGEGHFMALMRKEASKADTASAYTEDAPRVRPKKGSRIKTDRKNQISARQQKDQLRVLNEFLEQMGITLPDGAIDIRGEKVYLVPELPSDVRKLKFIRNGVFLGEVRKNRFEPAQPFALTLVSESCGAGASVCFAPDDNRLRAYLEGQTVTFDRGPDEQKKTPGRESLQSGWKLVCADRYGIGWAKYAAGVLKNKYPVSWR